MDYMLLLSVMSSILSIIGFIIALFREKKNAIKIIMIFCFVLFSSTSIYTAKLHKRLSRIETVQRAASRLVEQKDLKFSHYGFVQAGLSFLEMNKDLYPDTYSRAISILNKTEQSSSIYAELDAANAMRDILCGIAILNEDK